MSTECVIVARRGPALWLTINRPDEHNALSNEVLSALRAGVRIAKTDPAVRVLVITGAGERSFSAGGDLGQMGNAERAMADHQGRAELAGLFQDLWSLGKPTVARVRGYALAGGCGLAAACDFVVATEASAFGIPEVNVGLWPYMITIPLLQCMAPRTLLRLMLTGRRFTAEEAVGYGIVSDLVPDGDLDARVDELVERLVRVSPESVTLGRTAFYDVVESDVALRLRALQSMLTVNLDMPDAQEGLAAFKEKREPRWVVEAKDAVS